MYIFCAGDVASFDGEALQSAVAEFLYVELTQVDVSVSSASVLADVRVTSSQDGANEIYAALNVLDASAASVAFGVSVESIAVTPPALVAPPPPPLPGSVSSPLASGSSNLATTIAGGGLDGIMLLMVAAVAMLIFCCGCLCMLCTQKKFRTRLGHLTGRANRQHRRASWLRPSTRGSWLRPSGRDSRTLMEPAEFQLRGSCTSVRDSRGSVRDSRGSIRDSRGSVRDLGDSHGNLRGSRSSLREDSRLDKLAKGKAARKMSRRGSAKQGEMVICGRGSIDAGTRQMSAAV